VNIYVAKGSVRGSCGHKHHTLRAAINCVVRDVKLCASLGIDSDRDIVRADGVTLNDVEIKECIDIYMTLL
jgi:hypothetical protein